jgi:hypothetical protein
VLLAECLEERHEGGQVAEHPKCRVHHVDDLGRVPLEFGVLEVVLALVELLKERHGARLLLEERLVQEDAHSVQADAVANHVGRPQAGDELRLPGGGQRGAGGLACLVNVEGGHRPAQDETGEEGQS